VDGLRVERVEGPFDTEAGALHRIFELRIRDVFGIDTRSVR
jgi:hypothetical protein